MNESIKNVKYLKRHLSEHDVVMLYVTLQAHPFLFTVLNCNIKVNLSLPLIKHNHAKMYGGLEV
jgi:hypothetical protein